ncbi:hypothetical protein PCK1_000376 [Pneumocystis canis]|nr:hypothetical protein PCK1_000376 [Pneumocystis canis]
MYIYCITILRNDKKPAREFAKAMNLSPFGFFVRSSIQEFMALFSRMVAEEIQAEQRKTFNHDNYALHTYSRPEGVAGVIVCDSEYPTRVAYSLLSIILDEFLIKYPRASWPEQDDMCLPFTVLDEYIVKYQDPKKVDNITKVQLELDDIKNVLFHTIDSVLQRGEKLDDLVQRSDMLSAQSRLFYKQAKKNNSCCIIV